LSQEEIDLLDKYFKYDQILPYDLNLIISELNQNEFINLKYLLDGELCEKIFRDLYARVNDKLPKAWETLQYCSLLDPEAFPGFLIMELLNIDKFVLQNVANALKNNSLIEIITKLGENCLNIHRQTQEMVRKIGVSESLEKNVNRVILNKFEVTQEYNQTKWNSYKLLFSNVLIVYKSKYLDLEQKYKACDKLGFFFNYVTNNFNQSLKYWTECLETTVRIYGKNEAHLNKARSLGKVQIAYKN